MMSGSDLLVNLSGSAGVVGNLKPPAALPRVPPGAKETFGKSFSGHFKTFYRASPLILGTVSMEYSGIVTLCLAGSEVFEWA